MGGLEVPGAAVAALSIALHALPAAAQAPAAQVAQAEAVAFRHHAPITIEQPGAFVRLPLPVSAYAASRQLNLGDLRVVDARGARVPFALLPPRQHEAREAEQVRAADLYALPARRQGGAEPALPLEVQVVGDRITVRRLEPRSAGAAAASAAAAAKATSTPAGWLFDLGQARRDEPPARALRLAWAEPAEFTAAYELEVSSDLRQWRSAGGGQLLALRAPAGAAGSLPATGTPPAAGTPATPATSSSPGSLATPGTAGHLAQREVTLPDPGTAAASRFVRLRWLDPARAPVLTGAAQVRWQRSSVEVDAPARFEVMPMPMPMPMPEPSPPSAAPGLATKAVPAEGAQHYDLGAVLPVIELDLLLPAGHRLAAVRVQGRARLEEPWRDLAQTVFYRIERGEAVDRPPPLALSTGLWPVRYLRLVPDARAGALPAAPLAVRSPLLSIVFAPQGEAPFRLLAGAADAQPGALPLATLVPALDTERARFGRAQLGPFSENAEVARAEARQAQLSAWRPALLWAVLLLGVAGLGGAVWRLARTPAGARAGAAAAEPAPESPRA
jgi:hypothetical protein